MQLGIYRFKPSILLTLLVVGLSALFLSLGNWQLNRADEKRILQRDYERHTTLDPVKLLLPLMDVDEWRYRKVTVQGKFDTEKQFLLDNQVKNSIAGVNVLTPLKLQYQEKSVLVDRGWIPLGSDRTQLPNVSMDADIVSLVGTVYAPFGEGYRLGGMDEGQSSWPRLVQYLDFDEMSKRLGYAVEPLTIRLDASSPYGYQRNWPILQIVPERHVTYALQWFALAAVLVVIYLALSFKRSNSPKSANV